MDGQKKTCGAFWLKQKKDRDGNDITVLSGTVDLGVKTVNIVANKWKKEGESKPDYYAYPADGYQNKVPAPVKTDEECPF